MTMKTRAELAAHLRRAEAARAAAARMGRAVEAVDAADALAEIRAAEASWEAARETERQAARAQENGND
jgi:hypothetical protein